MKTLFWVLLLAGVGMGQTKPKGCYITEPDFKGGGVKSTWFDRCPGKVDGQKVGSVTEFVDKSGVVLLIGVAGEQVPDCDTTVIFRGTTKTVRELFPAECLMPRGKCMSSCSAASTAPCYELTECSTVTPKLEHAEPHVNFMPAMPEPPPPYTFEFNWQAIADHCHIETLVHHRSAADNQFGPGFDTPIPTNPQPDSWERVDNMRIVCKLSSGEGN